MWHLIMTVSRWDTGSLAITTLTFANQSAAVEAGYAWKQAINAESGMDAVYVVVRHA